MSTASKRLIVAPATPELLDEGKLWMQRLVDAAQQQGLDLLALIQSAETEERLPYVLSCSTFIGRTLEQHPEWLAELVSAPELAKPFTSSRFDGFLPKLEAADTDEFMRLLRQMRQREMVRIALRDLLGLADLSETLEALSALADICIQQAHTKAYAMQASRYGTPVGEEGEPQSLVVLAMGKLGGGELNYSSDIDLIFAYPEEGQTQPDSADQRQLDNHRFFLGQAQQLIKFLHETTVDGFVFRVDARLRPFGDSGALVVSYEFMESYYHRQGRDWERYAMIKARAVCGKDTHIDELQQILRPFVYRRYLDYDAFRALRDMKAMIVQEVARKGMQGNVKLGSGGIREIEFIGQAYQLIRGGQEPQLRERQIRRVLKLLAERSLLSNETVAALQQAYVFLRDTENRLQMVNDQQTHSLPENPLEQSRLAYAMGYVDWPAFEQDLKQHRASVNQAFEEVFFAHADEPADEAELHMLRFLEGQLSQPQALELFAEFVEPEEMYSRFESFFNTHAFRHSSVDARKKLAALLPNVLQRLSGQEEAAQVLHRVLELFQAIVQRPVYLALLNESPAALQQVIKLFTASGWIADYLVRQPILLDSLLDSEQLYSLPSKDELLLRLRDLMQAQKQEDPEQRLNAVRHFKQEQILRIAAVDVSEHLSLMKVSDQLTWLAEAILNQTHAVATKELVARHGNPGQNSDGKQPEMAVIAYGKLGGIELGYGSDLDIVFVHNSLDINQHSDGERAINNPTYFARQAQRLIHWLTTPTLGGVLYEADIRLRPDGASGMLVSSLEQFEQYQLERAWVWEHQALVRARMVVGGAEIAQAFADIRHRILTQKRDIPELKKAVVEMRERMRAEIKRSRQDEVDLKHAPGGLVDIEFIVQYGVLAWAYKQPELTLYPDNIRILEQFGQFGLMPDTETELLSQAYLTLREQAHRRALEGEQAVINQAQVASEMLQQVKAIWQKWLGDSD